jgi:phosphoserine phosphatase
VTDPLSTWRDGAAKKAIREFVMQTTGDAGSNPVPEEERVAVFDNDGTLWCEKPMPIQLHFILERLSEMAAAQPELREREPWRGAFEKEYSWLGAAVTEHYAGDDAKAKVLGGAILGAYEGISVEEFEDQADTFLRGTNHPTLERPYVRCAYAPMVELLGYLSSHGFANYISSGGGRDFMRPISRELYGIPRDRVIGSTAELDYAPGPRGGTITHKASAEYLDDGPVKPLRIWSRVGRRPVLAAGNSNGDIQMLDYSQHDDKPCLRLLLLHDDPEREFDYTTGAEQALDRAGKEAWTVVSIKNDWARVF